MGNCPDTVWTIERASEIPDIRPSFRSPRNSAYYETEAIAGGWSVRQLDRQIGTQFYERSLGSKNRDEFLARGRGPRREDMMTVEEEVRDPYLLEFLNLKDEYGESDLEEALIRHLEWSLLEEGDFLTPTPDK